MILKKDIEILKNNSTLWSKSYNEYDWSYDYLCRDIEDR